MMNPFCLLKSWLSLFLLTKLCIIVSSYSVDPSCWNFRGQDIEPDITLAFHEAFDMAGEGFIQSNAVNLSANPLLNTLFGVNLQDHRTIIDYFSTFANLQYSPNYLFICDDLMVNLMTDSVGRSKWVNHAHAWYATFENFTPCDPTRKPGAPFTIKRVAAYTLFNRFIYLCLVILDYPNGRVLAPYKDRYLPGQWIDDYALVPLTIFHELLRGNLIHSKFSFRSRMIFD